MKVHYKVKYILIIGPIYSTLSFYPREMKTCAHSYRHLNVHRSLFVVTPNCRVPRCPLTSEWINKSWYIHGIQVRNKKNKLLKYTKTWMNQENPLLNEIDQIQHGAILGNSTWVFYKNQYLGNNKQIRGCQGLGVGHFFLQSSLRRLWGKCKCSMFSLW